MSLISTVGGIQTAIARKLNQLEVSSERADRYLDWINEGLDDMYNQFPQATWLQSSSVMALAAGFGEYQTSAFQAGIFNFVDIRISSHEVKLKFLEKNNFDALDPKPDSLGIPTVFTLFNDTIQFYPIPNDTAGVQANYQIRPGDVSAASATPIVPRNHLKALIFYGWAQGLYDKEDFNEAQIVEAKYQAEIDRIKKLFNQRSLEPKRTISIREIQVGNRVAGDEITRAFFNS